MGQTSEATLTAYVRTLDSATLVRDLAALGDWVTMAPENRRLRRVLIDELCDRHPGMDAAIADYTTDAATIADAAREYVGTEKERS